MSRFKRRPAGYAPGLEYYLRERPEGGRLRRPGDLRTRANAPDARRHCLVLVHGYNNHEGEAATAYLGFRTRQYALFEDLLPGDLEKKFGDTFWPGDADWPGPLDWLDFLAYPDAVGNAEKAAPLLAELLMQMPALESVDFVAHSLGCRLALETINLLYQSGHPAIGRICLMAAAVPCEMVEPGGRFEPALLGLQAAGTRIRVLHSKTDLVLKFAFPAGQLLAGEETRGALGRFGPPVDMPGRGATVTEQRIADAGHSDYWGAAAKPADEQATREAGTFLGIGSRPRTIAARVVGDARDVGTTRDIGWQPEV